MPAAILVTARPPVRFADSGTRHVREPSSVINLLATEVGQLGIAAQWISAVGNDALPGAPLCVNTARGAIFPALGDADGFRSAYAFATRALWFVHHGLKLNLAPTDWTSGMADLRALTMQIARVVKARLTDQTVVVNDYQLSLVAGELRRRGVRARVAFMQYTPFASLHDWLELPSTSRRDVIVGILGADLVGFTAQGWADRFIEAVRADALGEWDQATRSIHHRGGTTAVRVYPLFIAPDRIRAILASGQGFARPAGCHFLFARADRLDPAKNALVGFQAYENLLEELGELWPTVHFAAVLSPTRTDMEEYRVYRDLVMGAVGRIARRFPGAVSVSWDESHIRALEIAREADAVVVNSVADGMNLFVQEAAVVNRRACVLLLSRDTGSAAALGDATLELSDPRSVDTTRAAMDAAMLMEREDREYRSVRAVSRIESGSETLLGRLRLDLDATGDAPGGRCSAVGVRHAGAGDP